jgi:hypothetical protein
MRVENREKMLEKLATSDRIAIVIERQPDGKMRTTSGSWDGEKVLSVIRCSRSVMRVPMADCTSLAN